MCGRYTLTSLDGRLVAERFEAKGEPDEETLGRFNVCPTEQVAAVTADPERTVRAVRWGLVPRFARELGRGFQPINLKAETATTRKPFSALVERADRRCLVPADGWYEWLKPEKRGGERVPFRYTVDGGELFAFAGVWDRRRIEDREVISAAIFTTTANEISAPVHDRMPCVLTGPEEEDAWLAGELDGLLVPLPSARTTVAPANPAVNRAGVEGPQLLHPPTDQPTQLRF